MLIELEITGFAIIDHLRIPFGPGLNVLTGETGAGKSIIIDALGLALGDRSAAGTVRTGAPTARVEATFDFSRHGLPVALAERLEHLEIETEEGLLILSRELTAGGRSVARINGRPTSVSVLNEIGGQLVDIHGQSEHLSLLQPVVQLEILDRYCDTGELRSMFGQRLAEWRSLRERLDRLERDERDRVQLIDLLTFQFGEIARAALESGEEETLTAEALKLANIARLGQTVAATQICLEGVDGETDPGSRGGTTNLQIAGKELAAAALLDPALNDLAGRMEELAILVADLSSEIRSYGTELQADPARLEQIDDRLDLIRKLKRKYGDTIPEIVAFGEIAGVELAELEGVTESRQALQQRDAEFLKQLSAMAAELHERRVNGGVALGKAVEDAITGLNMGAARFTVEVRLRQAPDGLLNIGTGSDQQSVAFDASGADSVEFMLSPHSGEAQKPLARIASGGETARLMLALRSVLSVADATPTLVFDEIEVGVGGRSGQVVGQLMHTLSRDHQVLTITHLPQIAVFADAHLRIEKQEREGRTAPVVTLLDEAARIEEIAAMIDGEPLTTVSRAKAMEMLDRSRNRAGL